MDENGTRIERFSFTGLRALGYRVVELRFETQAGDRLVRTPSYNWEVLI
jgi:hypothetical protein